MLYNSVMDARRIGFVIALLLWIGILAVAAIGLQLDLLITVILGLIGLFIVARLFRDPYSAPAPFKRSKMPPSYEVVAQKLDQIEAEMKRVGLWQDKPLDPEQYDFRAAFAGDTMAFPQWLQFIFLRNVRAIIASKDKFPASSQVGAYAVREFDTYAEDTSRLQRLLSEFDALF